MAFTLTAQEKQSLGITITIFALLFLFLIFVGYSENHDLVDLEGGGGGGGVTVNFGDSDVGSGADYHSEVLKVSEKVKQTPAAATPEDEVLASDLDDAPTVVKTKPVIKKDPTKEETKPVTIKGPPHPSKTASDALANIMNGSAKGGDGDDGQAGNKGRQNGSLSSGSYDGSGGSGGGTGGGTGSGNGTGTGPGSGSGSGGGSGAGRGTGVGNYSLAGRKALAIPSPKYNCNEEGVVVVSISVDRNGKVIAATPGARGTTNSAKCLQDQAKIAAMNAKFDAGDSDKQVGTIIYNFKLKD
jgi:outer membrane biosynthesis protein TonB